MLIEELMDDNSNPVVMTVFGVTLNRSLRSVFVGAFGVSVALLLNKARAALPVPTGGAFIDPSE